MELFVILYTHIYSISEQSDYIATKVVKFSKLLFAQIANQKPKDGYFDCYLLCIVI